MATQDRSPSLFAGQPWSALADSWSTADEKESKVSKESETKKDISDSMKLRKDDKYLYGVCPAQDEFYLVVCEKCNQVIKPQALKKHMVARHGLKDSKALIKASLETDFPKTGPDVSPRESRRSMLPTKASLKQPPSSAIANLVPKMAALPGKVSGSGISASVKKSHPMPVVKVERMPEQLAKRIASSASNLEPVAKPALINGTVKLNSAGAAAPMTPPMMQPTHASVVATVTTTVTTTTTSKTSLTSSGAALSSAVVTTVTASVTTKPVTLSTTAAPSLLNVAPTSTTAASAVGSTPVSNKKSPKERKFLPLKDREFDADKHCGCYLSETGKQCTRSLTCKSHALSLRRAVKGRSKTFDDLLKEHRAAKELLLKQKAESKAAAAAGAGPGAGPGGGGGAKSSHSDSSAHAKDGSVSSHSKVPHHPPSMHPSQKLKSHTKPHNSVFQKPTSSSSLQQSVTHIKEEPNNVTMDTAGGRLSAEDGDDDQDRVDATYLPYHPQPAAMCRFGARINGNGCYAFSRRNDYVRAAFLSALERHLHPPPHKKLCVESNLPRESHLVINSKDPYEFNMDDVSAGLMNCANRSAMKPKSKPTLPLSNSSTPSISLAQPANPIRTAKSPRDNSAGSRSPGASSGAVPQASNPSKRKRSGSSQGGTLGGGNVHMHAVVSSTSVGQSPVISNVIGTMAALSAPSTPLTAITIPNLSGATIGHFNATLTSKQNQVPKNNINLKDFNLVLTGIESLNGQYIASAQFADMANQQVVTVADDKNALHRSRTIGAAKTAKLSNHLDLKALHNSSVLMSQNAVLMDGLQGTVLSPVNITSLGNSGIVTQQSSPATVQSPLLRTESVSPQVSMPSPLPNGIVSSTTDKSNQRHTSHRVTSSGHNNKSGGGGGGATMTMSLSPGLLQATPTQLCSNQALTQLQVKPGTLGMKGMTGKITMQPMSVTIPIMNPALPGQQGQPHTLLVTTSSEDGTTKQELHLQQLANSPSNLIS